MDVLALYDIHGNPDALDAVLADPRAAGADAVVVGGDAVPGPFAAAVLDRLGALDVPVHRIRGNGEREVAEAPPAGDDLVAETARRSAAELGPERARALGALPLTARARRRPLLPREPAPRRRDAHAALAGRALRRRARGRDGARSWSPATRTSSTSGRSAGVRYVNAGSVGLPYEGDGAARWLWVADGEPAFRSTTYDAAGAGRRMLRAGWPDGRSVGGALTDPVDPLVVTRIFEDLSG